eukprot:RCo030219
MPSSRSSTPSPTPPEGRLEPGTVAHYVPKRRAPESCGCAAESTTTAGQDGGGSDDEETARKEAMASWCNISARGFNVRKGPDYRIHGQKEPSADALYEVFAVDTYQSTTKKPHFGQYVNLPEDTERSRTGLPATIVINLMVPSYAPGFIYTAGDGEGWCVSIYARLSQRSRRALYQNKPTPGMLLLKRFVEAQPGDPLRRRFKCIARNVNPGECGFNAATRALIYKYNAKPFVVRDTSSFYLTDRYFEIDIDVHRFGKPARIGLYGCSAVLTDMVLEWAFVLEGETNEELPEQILCALRLAHLDPARVVPLRSTLPPPDAPYRPSPYAIPPLDESPDEATEELNPVFSPLLAAPQPRSAAETPTFPPGSGDTYDTSSQRSGSSELPSLADELEKGLNNIEGGNRGEHGGESDADAEPAAEESVPTEMPTEGNDPPQ